MKKLGFVGARSVQSVHFGQVLAGGVPGLDSESGRVWAPDAPEMLDLRMAQADFAGSFERIEDLFSGSDAVLILLLEGDSHRELAEACLARRKPVYVCNPFSWTLEDAVAMTKCAARYKTPITGGSALIYLPEVSEVAALAQHASEITISFAAEWDSAHGGWFLEGSHLTDLCAAVAGCGATNVSAAAYGKAVAAVVEYPRLRVRLLSLPEQEDLRFSVQMRDGEIKNWAVQNYESGYRVALERFSRLIRDGVSVDNERLIFSADLLESIVKSLPDRKNYPTGIA